MKEQVAIQNLLRQGLSGIQRQNPRYSLRAYSKKVGVHVGALTNIINGKRNVSRKLAERIVERLGLDPQARAEVLSLFPEKRRYAKPGIPAPEPRYLELSAAQFRAMAEWEHFALLSLAECDDFESDAAAIGRRLGITEARARQVTERLLQLGLMRLEPSGKLELTRKGFRTSDDIADLSLKKHHEQGLDLAKESLYRDAVGIRDFTSVTLAIDPRKLGMAKERIRRFQDDLSELVESGHRTEVYRLSMQLFPLSVPQSPQEKK